MQSAQRSFGTWQHSAQLAGMPRGHHSAQVSQRITSAQAQDTQSRDTAQEESGAVGDRHSNGAAMHGSAGAAHLHAPYWQRVANEVSDPESIKVVAVELMAQVRTSKHAFGQHDMQVGKLNRWSTTLLLSAALPSSLGCLAACTCKLHVCLHQLQQHDQHTATS